MCDPVVACFVGDWPPIFPLHHQERRCQSRFPNVNAFQILSIDTVFVSKAHQGISMHVKNDRPDANATCPKIVSGVYLPRGSYAVI